MEDYSDLIQQYKDNYQEFDGYFGNNKNSKDLNHFNDILDKIVSIDSDSGITQEEVDDLYQQMNDVNDKYNGVLLFHYEYGMLLKSLDIDVHSLLPSSNNNSDVLEDALPLDNDC